MLHDGPLVYHRSLVKGMFYDRSLGVGVLHELKGLPLGVYSMMRHYLNVYYNID